MTLGQELEEFQRAGRELLEAACRDVGLYRVMTWLARRFAR